MYAHLYKNYDIKYICILTQQLQINICNQAILVLTAYVHIKGTLHLHFVTYIFAKVVAYA